MPTLLAFGDSNTHGTPPIITRGEVRRFGPETRWPTVAHAALGPGWHLVEEGLPGRTAQFPDPVMGAHMDGREGLKMALMSHGPIDVLAIMLGTNDVKMRYGASPETIRGGIAALLDLATTLDAQARHPAMKILLICPPPVLEQGPIRDEFLGGREKGLALPPLYQALARDRGLAFLDAGKVIEVSPTDGVHLEADAQRVLGQAVAEVVGGM
ncbi:MAG: SGNH/GDSL hydrolase family protein [Paracoccaceae bacterium]